MKPYRILEILLFIAASTMRAQNLNSAVERNSDLGTALEFTKELAAVKGDMPSDVQQANAHVYAQALPEVRKALAAKLAASPARQDGKARASEVPKEALFDIYKVTLERENDRLINFHDVIDSVSETSYVSVWSDPADANFRLVRNQETAWEGKTNAEHFLLKSDYVLHIEKSGYEPLERTCSNQTETGANCGGKLTLKKKD